MEQNTPKKKLKPRERPHYVNNKEFSQSVVDYVTSVNEAREKTEDEPIITEYIGRCFLKIAEGLSHKPNFVGYTYREERYMDHAGASAFMDVGDHPDSNSIVDRVRYKSQQFRTRDDKIKEFGKVLKRKTRAKKKIVGGLENFI